MDQVKPFWKENSLNTASNQHENVGAIKEKIPFCWLVMNFYKSELKKIWQLNIVQSRNSREWKFLEWLVRQDNHIYSFPTNNNFKETDQMMSLSKVDDKI